MYLSIGIYVFVYFVFVYFCVFCVCIFVGSTFVKAGPGFRSRVTSTFYLLSHTTQSVTRRILHPLSIVPTCEKKLLSSTDFGHNVMCQRADCSMNIVHKYDWHSRGLDI